MCFSTSNPFSPRENLKGNIIKKCEELIRPAKAGEEFEVGCFKIKVLGPFANSDGNISDIYLCEKKPIDSKDNQTKKVLMKQLRISESAIAKMIDSLNRNEKKLTKTRKGLHELVSIKAPQLLKSFPIILKREGDIARLMYGNDFILSSDNTRLIMPLLPGNKLFSEENRDYIAKLNLEKRIELISKIVNAVSRLHIMKIGHFDLKPENILFNPETGEIFIIDFGTSFFLNEFDEILPERVGTPEYISPEAKRGCIGLKTDDYAVGQMINEILFEKINPKEEKLNTDWQELKNMVQAFAYRLQGRNQQGICSVEEEELKTLSPSVSIKNTSYFAENYLTFRPQYNELKLFFDYINQYIDRLKNQSFIFDLAFIKDKLQQLAYPKISFNVSVKDNYSDEEYNEKLRKNFNKIVMEEEKLVKKEEIITENSESKITNSPIKSQKRLSIQIPRSNIPESTVSVFFTSPSSGGEASVSTTSNFKQFELLSRGNISAFSSLSIFSPNSSSSLDDDEVATPIRDEAISDIADFEVNTPKTGV